MGNESTLGAFFSCLRCKGIHANGYVCDYGESNGQQCSWTEGTLGHHLRCDDHAETGSRFCRRHAMGDAARRSLAQHVEKAKERTEIGCGVRGLAYTQARTFTREEVLTVLKTLRAGGPDGAHADAVRNTYDIAIRTFERME